MGNAERVDLNAIAMDLDPAKLAEAADFIGYLKAKRELDEESCAWLGAVEPIEPYEWGGVDPLSLGEPVEYVEGVGAVVKNA